MAVEENQNLSAQGDIFDVVVVGSGAGGLATALTAAANGLSVVVLEKEARFGGTTARAGGGFWIPNNKFQKDHGVDDDMVKAEAYLQYSAGNQFDKERVAAFLENGPRMIEFFEENGDFEFYLAPGYSDYHPHAQGALESGRTLFPLPYDGLRLGEDLKRLASPIPEMTVAGMHVGGRELIHFYNITRSFRSATFIGRKFGSYLLDVMRHGRGTHLSNGASLVARFVRSLRQRGVRILTSCPVTELLVEQGRVVGVRAAPGGRETQYRARRAVVLASGGFPHNLERRAQFYRHTKTGAEHWSPAYEVNTGDGMAMAEHVGAAVLDGYRNAAAWAPVSLTPRRGGRYGVFPHFVDRAKPGLIAVNRAGKRFTNEANSYHDFGQAMLRTCEGEEVTEAFLIADHRAFRRYGMGAARPFPVPYGKHLRSGYLTRGATLRELGGKLGINGAELESSVQSFNEGARTGKDPEFQRGENAYNRYYGDATHAPNTCLAPLEQGPFYGMRLVMGDLGSFVGLRTDAHARVLSKQEKPIEALYAVGNDAASVFGGAYPGGGSTLGPAMTFGYIAGKHIAGA